MRDLLFLENLGMKRRLWLHRLHGSEKIMGALFAGT